ncbi:MAG: helix-hairpin-helix domain-containing protein [Flavobacterium sp.]|nr:MAG: helix-hairpin-helix domain-containing protein [Flavobacterium sp.]
MIYILALLRKLTFPMNFKLLLLFCVFCNTASAIQQDLIKDVIERIAESFPEDYDISELQEQLEYLNKHPIDLNNTSFNELNQLLFLSPLQIKNILEHINLHGKLLDLSELQAIDGFSINTINNILPFVTLNSKKGLEIRNLGTTLRQADNELMFRFTSLIERPKGYSINTGNNYIGGIEKFWFKYSYKVPGLITSSLVIEKDAGEKIRFLPDHLVGNISLFNIWKFKKAVVGNYSLQFGQGLTLWSGFSFGKGSDIATLSKKDDGLKGYASANEYSYLSGVATTLNLNKQLEATFFVSNRNLDGNIPSNAPPDAEFTSISETGLHRTKNELLNQGSIGQFIYGTAVQYQRSAINLGAVLYRSSYTHAFSTGSRIYDKFNITGNKLVNAGIYYSYNLHNFYFFGELARSFKGGPAIINGMLISLSPSLSFGMVHRNYSLKYYNLFSSSLAEGGNPSNENGFYSSLNITPNKFLTISLQADHFSFPWLKFRVDEPSQGYELQIQSTYVPNRSFKLTGRFRKEIKQQNTDGSPAFNFTESVNKENLRMGSIWKISKSIEIQNNLEITKYQKGQKPTEYGHMVFQDIQYAGKSILSGNIHLAYFNTGTYNTRIYSYEKDVLYGFAFGMYNGKGFRGVVNIKCKFNKHTSAWMRYAAFLYPGLKLIGSGPDEITGNKKQEIKIQLRHQF